MTAALREHKAAAEAGRGRGALARSSEANARTRLEFKKECQSRDHDSCGLKHVLVDLPPPFRWRDCLRGRRRGGGRGLCACVAP